MRRDAIPATLAAGGQTIRQFLAARKRKLVFLAIASWLGILVSMVVGGANQLPPSWVAPSVLVFFAGFIGATVGLLLFLRCPRCKGSLGATNAPLVKEHFGSLGRRINFCPYCGVSLDEPNWSGTSTTST